MSVRVAVMAVLIVSSAMSSAVHAKEKHPCLDKSQPDMKVRLEPGKTIQARNRAMDLSVSVEKGRFRCSSETSPTGLGFCGARVSQIQLAMKGSYKDKQDNRKYVLIPSSAYEGLEHAWKVSSNTLSDTTLRLSFDVKDGAGAATVCLIFNRGKLSRKAVVLFYGEDIASLYEETIYEFPPTSDSQGPQLPDLPSLATLSSLNIIDGCEGEGCGCTYAKVTNKPFTLFDSIGKSKTPIATFSTAVPGKILASFSSVRSSGKYRVNSVRNQQSSLKRGQIITHLFYLGEGLYNARYRGRLVQFAHDDVKLAMVRKTKLVPWFMVAAGGKVGYTNVFPFDGCLE